MFFKWIGFCQRISRLPKGMKKKQKAICVRLDDDNDDDDEEEEEDDDDNDNQ